MTRPRIDSSVVIWIAALAAVIIVSAASPAGIDSIANSEYPGASPRAISSRPKAAAPMMTSLNRGLARRAAIREPASAPTAMKEPRIPYSPACFPYTSVAMRALVSWKFKPKAETTAMRSMMSTMSGREAT